MSLWIERPLSGFYWRPVGGNEAAAERECRRSAEFPLERDSVSAGD